MSGFDCGGGDLLSRNSDGERQGEDYTESPHGGGKRDEKTIEHEKHSLERLYSRDCVVEEERLER